MKPFSERNKIKIESNQDFNLVADDMFTEFLESITDKKWGTRPINEDDFGVDDAIAFMYSDRAEKLIERYRQRMCKVGNTHFPDGDIECNSHLYVEM